MTYRTTRGNGNDARNSFMACVSVFHDRNRKRVLRVLPDSDKFPPVDFNILTLPDIDILVLFAVCNRRDCREGGCFVIVITTADYILTVSRKNNLETP